MNLNDKAYIPTIKDMAMAIDAENVSESGLTLKQEAFCKAYTKAGSETFGNQTLSYAEAFGFDLAMADRQRATSTVTVEGKETEQEIKGSSEYEKMYSYCGFGGSRLMLKNTKVVDRIQELMVENFDNDAVMDKRLIDIALNGKDTDSIQAIKHRSDIKQRITKKLDVTTAGRPLANLTDEELLKLAGE